MQAKFVPTYVQAVVRAATIIVAVAVAGCFDLGAITAGEIKIPFVTPVQPMGQDIPGDPIEPPIEEPIRPLDTPEALPNRTGDLNDDGSVDERDLEAFGGLYLLYQEGGAADATADLDGDGAITPADLRRLLDLIMAGGSRPADRPALPR